LGLICIMWWHSPSHNGIEECTALTWIEAKNLKNIVEYLIKIIKII
jgi:hypothetical protein